MRRRVAILALVPVVVLAALAPAAARELPRLPETDTVYGSAGSASRAVARTAPERFYLYGAPGTGEGTFSIAGVHPDRQGWTGVDLTDMPNAWHVSSFNAETLGGHGVGNLAAWCGQDAAQRPGWATAPGYGNNWQQQLVWTSPPLADPSIAQTVELDFVFHHDLEPFYDFFTVAYDTDGTNPDVFTIGDVITHQTDGTDADGDGRFSVPGTRFADVQTQPIVFAGGDYGGVDGDRIVIRLTVTSDHIWSDEDGFFDSDGAVQIDDIVVQWNDGTGVIQESSEDFQGVDPFTNGMWRAPRPPLAGDFSSVLMDLVDFDPCWDNASPVMTFIDYGQEVGNAANAALAPGGRTSTGGSRPASWYDFLDPWYVLNYTGGVSNDPATLDDGPALLNNEVWSPEIAFDLPGTEDDDPELRGILVEATAYEHFPLSNGLFWDFRARAADAAGNWTPWRGDDFVEWAARARWTHNEYRIEGLFPDVEIDRLQIAFGVWDLSEVFGFPGTDATPGLYLDDVRVSKVRVSGPTIRVRTTDLAVGGFPRERTVDLATVAGRDALDVPFASGRVTQAGGSIVLGDSVAARIEPVLGGVTLADVALLWVLDRNPLFDDVRTPPSRPQDRNVDTASVPGRWSGETIGLAIANRPGWFAFDLPDVDFLYPGDVLRYHLRAIDSEGRVSTLPHDLIGFDGTSEYAEEFTVRALPSYHDASGDQPRALVVDYGRSATERQALRLMLAQIGWAPGRDYDFYRRTTDEGATPQPLGSGDFGGPGATLSQLRGYRVVLFDHSANTVGLTEGTTYQPGNDFALLTAWMALDAPRTVLHIGLDRGGGLDWYGIDGFVYADLLGMELRNTIVLPVSDRLRIEAEPLFSGPDFDLLPACREDQASPVVGSALSGYPPPALRGWTELGGAASDRWLLQPIATTASIGHVYVDRGTGLDVGAASVFNLIAVSLNGRVKQAISTTLRPGEGDDRPHPGGLLPTSRWFRTLLGSVDRDLTFGFPTSAPSVRAPFLAAAPTPFNPRTVLSFAIPRSGPVSVAAFDVRGRRVRTLVDGELEGGVEHHVEWDGTDDAGARVGSGVYYVAATAGEWNERVKVVLLK